MSTDRLRHNPPEAGDPASGRANYRPLLTAAQVAEWLNISERSVRTLVSEGKLVPLRVKGRVVRFSPVQIEAYIRHAARQ